MPIEIDMNSCLLCEACVAACPTGAIRRKDGDMNYCIVCGACVKACPVDALELEDLEREVNGEEVELKRIAWKPEECHKEDPPQCGEVCPQEILRIEDSYPELRGFCVMCLKCMETCPIDAIGVKGVVEPKSEPPEHPEDEDVYVHPERCVGCTYCLQVCPTDAIEMVPTEVEFFKAEENEWSPVYVDPDTMELNRGRKVAKIDPEKCTGCTLCVQVCPWGAITAARDVPVQSREVENEIDEDKCVGCGVCAEVCPGDLIEVDGVAKVPEKCPACKLCERACSVDAISINVSYERSGEME
ncbi:4Fe-4S binding protein [Methanopyrus sp.]